MTEIEPGNARCLVHFRSPPALVTGCCADVCHPGSAARSAGQLHCIMHQVIELDPGPLTWPVAAGCRKDRCLPSSHTGTPHRPMGRKRFCPSLNVREPGSKGGGGFDVAVSGEVTVSRPGD